MSLVSEFTRGVSYFLRGVRTWGTNPRLMFMGAIPAIIVSLLMFAALFLLIPQAYPLATSFTGFADSWVLWLRETIRITLGISMCVALVLVMLVSFTAITLLVGGPFYERIQAHVERELGGVPDEARLGLRAQAGKVAGDTVQALGMGLSTGVVGFFIGLIPVIGAPIATVFVTWRGSRAVAAEVTAVAGDVRGWTFKQRLQRLDRRRMRTFGAAFPAYLAFMVPGGAVLAMPAAVVAGTLLARDLSDVRFAPDADV